MSRAGSPAGDRRASESTLPVICVPGVERPQNQGRHSRDRTCAVECSESELTSLYTKNESKRIIDISGAEITLTKEEAIKYLKNVEPKVPLTSLNRKPLEIPENEFKFNQIHRYSVIAHEYFHVYQMSLSKSFFDGDIELKWLTEGTAASFESIFIQQFYEKNYFLEAQTEVDISAVNNPKIFEKFDLSSDKDQNYSSSVFIALALTKELQKKGISEEKAFRLIYKDFWELNPTDNNWKIKFEQLFSFTVEHFYTKLGDYTNDLNNVIPSENIKIENIFN